MHADLRAQDVRCGRKRVARLMRQPTLVVRTRRRCTPRTTDSQHGFGIAPNVLDRQFAVERPNQVRVSDITYLPTREDWLYLAVVLDLYARRVVGWSMQPRLERTVVLAALADAIGRRRPAAGVLHHSDRGSQYASGEYQQLLATHGLVVRMSRTGNCWDNAAMESFFATLKAELPQAEFASHAEARSTVFDSIERFYNRQPRHSTLEYQTPLGYELDYAASHAE
jgi:transposase InsO family protein